MVTAGLLCRRAGRRWRRGAFRSWPGRTGGSCRCTATGCPDPSPAPRTPPRTRCWPPGKASAGSLGTRLAAHLAVQDRRQPVPERAPRSEPPPGQASGTCPGPGRPAGPREEAVWLQPFLTPSSRVPPACCPAETRYEQAEAISLAFVAALQLLPQRETVVLICATSSDSTQRRRGSAGGRPSTRSTAPSTEPAPASSACAAQASGRQARRRPSSGRRGRDRGQVRPRSGRPADLDALVALLTGDVFIAMPPVPFGYQGRDAVTRYCARLFGAGRRSDLVPVRANGQPAFGACLRGPAGTGHATGLLRAHPGRRPDLRHHPLRGQRAAVVRAAAITPEPVAGGWRNWPAAGRSG